MIEPFQAVVVQACIQEPHRDDLRVATRQRPDIFGLAVVHSPDPAPELAALGYERSVRKIPLRLRVERRRTWARIEGKRIGRALRRRVRGAWQRLGSPVSSEGGWRAP